MRILVLSNNDLASLFALNLLLSELAEHTVQVGLSSKVGGDYKHPQALLDLTTFENQVMGDDSHAFLKSIKVRFVAIRGSHFYKSFDQLSNAYDIEIQFLNDINQIDGLNQVRLFNPELILSIRYGKILKQPVIDIPSMGVINLHSGLLPAYQGIMATFWAMLNEEKDIGTCLHFISDRQIDAGEIIEQSIIPLNPYLSYLENVLEVYWLGIKNMAKAVNQLNRGVPLLSDPQQGFSNYYGFPQEPHIKKFLDKGFRFF